jgi:hypothetical protein
MKQFWPISFRIKLAKGQKQNYKNYILLLFSAIKAKDCILYCKIDFIRYSEVKICPKNFSAEMGVS